jgi:hypothetical protein
MSPGDCDSARPKTALDWTVEVDTPTSSPITPPLTHVWFLRKVKHFGFFNLCNLRYEFARITGRFDHFCLRTWVDTKSNCDLFKFVTHRPHTLDEIIQSNIHPVVGGYDMVLLSSGISNPTL